MRIQDFINIKKKIYDLHGGMRVMCLNNTHLIQSQAKDMPTLYYSQFNEDYWKFSMTPNISDDEIIGNLSHYLNRLLITNTYDEYRIWIAKIMTDANVFYNLLCTVEPDIRKYVE